jgi:hypothetical protein
LKRILATLFVLSLSTHGNAAPVGSTTGKATDTGTPQKIFFRYSGVDRNYGKVAFVDAGRTGSPQFVDGLMCEVVYVAGERGICLGAEYRILGIFAATLFDARTFGALGKVPVKGIPSRARVAVNGKIAASTVFTSGHGYDSVSFSTQTLLIDVASAQIIADVEAFSVQRDGKPFKNKDFNFWGVTFSPDSRYFYATLSTQRQHLLVKGDIAARSAVVIHDNVECPSLSPDGKRIAYKKRLKRPGNVAWQLHVFDLASGKDTPLAEKRSVDDQLEWFNDEFLLYTLPDSETRATPVTNVWRIGADGNTPPELFLKNAYSPAVVRAAQ